MSSTDSCRPHPAVCSCEDTFCFTCLLYYTTTQPANLRVIWYLFQSSGYPPVYDERQSVNSKFSGRTSLIGSVRDGNCSLKIDRLEMSHNQDRLYPWIDKNPITSYHIQGFSFNDKTSQIIVSGNYLDNFLFQSFQP